ncbi:Uncharacterized protein dnm_095320 [Desulfonema magnum]|uniref:Uncharacterized protein n=1 Tax=Desulfonema magnum TaxID=45655 RepID=A0A975GTU6_9BACT|nr:Uncharacterized protein dnm_095320 [Desulfonema magnum]
MTSVFQISKKMSGVKTWEKQKICSEYLIFRTSDLNDHQMENSNTSS